jgi:hypothetical protein
MQGPNRLKRGFFFLPGKKRAERAAEVDPFNHLRQ